MVGILICTHLLALAVGALAAYLHSVKIMEDEYKRETRGVPPSGRPTGAGRPRDGW